MKKNGCIGEKTKMDVMYPDNIDLSEGDEMDVVYPDKDWTYMKRK